MGCRILHLVRHGEYRTDGGERLTDRGRAQSELLAARLAPLPIQRVTSSTSPRARQTAEPLERVFPKAKGRPWSSLCEGIPCEPRFPLPQSLPERPDEAWTRERERLDAVCARLLTPPRRDREEVVVFHGNLLRAVVCRALDLPVQAWWELDIFHCSLTTLKVRSSRNRLVRFNDTGHLPPGLLEVW